MAILGHFRADQLIGQLTSQTDTNSQTAQKSIERLKKIRPKVIPRIIDALAMSDKSHTMVFVDILSSYVNDETLKFVKEGLSDGGARNHGQYGSCCQYHSPRKIGSVGNCDAKRRIKRYANL
jgi:hypothetical protein